MYELLGSRTLSDTRCGDNGDVKPRGRLLIQRMPHVCCVRDREQTASANGQQGKATPRSAPWSVTALAAVLPAYVVQEQAAGISGAGAVCSATMVTTPEVSSGHRGHAAA